MQHGLQRIGKLSGSKAQKLPGLLCPQNQHRAAGQRIAKRISGVLQGRELQGSSPAAHLHRQELPLPFPREAQGTKQQQAGRCRHQGDKARMLQTQGNPAQSHAQHRKQTPSQQGTAAEAEGNPAHEPKEDQPPKRISQKAKPRQQTGSPIEAPQSRRQENPPPHRGQSCHPVYPQKQQSIHQTVQQHHQIQVNLHPLTSQLGQVYPLPGKKKVATRPPGDRKFPPKRNGC